MKLLDVNTEIRKKKIFKYQLEEVEKLQNQ